MIFIMTDIGHYNPRFALPQITFNTFEKCLESVFHVVKLVSIRVAQIMSSIAPIVTKYTGIQCENVLYVTKRKFQAHIQTT